MDSTDSSSINLTVSNSTTASTTDAEEDPPRWPGALMIVYSTCCIFAYALCMLTILRNKETRKVPSYQIILHIGSTDLIQLALNGVLGGVFSLCQSDFDFRFNTIVGGVMNSGWITYTMMADLLAWNRCLQTYRPAVAKRVFTMRSVRWMLAACWTYGLAWVITYNCPGLFFYYIPEEHAWDYGWTAESRRFATAELVQDSVHCISMVICYSAIFGKLASQVKQIANTQVNTDKKEKLVLLQSIWICATTISVVIWFFFGANIITNHWNLFFTTMVWLTCAGSNAFIYLIFNKNIRRQVKEMLKCGRGSIGPGDVASTKLGPTMVSTAQLITVGPARRSIAQQK